METNKKESHSEKRSSTDQSLKNERFKADNANDQNNTDKIEQISYA